MLNMKKARQKKDVGITGRTAKWYDRMSRKSRLGEMREYADFVNARTSKGANVLEVAPGPGYLAIELAKRGFAVTGVELSEDFVRIAKQNALESDVDVNFIRGLFIVQINNPLTSINLA
ncbi:MAG: class I SAM-dependent methyltransferase [Oscillospiraceae bacterium]|nr:class I SAM-dependent methyltransferase [Oscillospiraceae bacterium]